MNHKQTAQKSATAGLSTSTISLILLLAEDGLKIEEINELLNDVSLEEKISDAYSRREKIFLFNDIAELGNDPDSSDGLRQPEMSDAEYGRYLVHKYSPGSNTLCHELKCTGRVITNV